MPIRVATTGETHGPELPKAIALLGKEKVLARIRKHLWLTNFYFAHMIK